MIFFLTNTLLLHRRYILGHLVSCYDYFELKYDEKGPVISEITRISKPGRRVYSGAGRIPYVQNGLGISIISTSKGVMTDADARDQKVGGEIICRVF